MMTLNVYCLLLALAIVSTVLFGAVYHVAANQHHPHRDSWEMAYAYSLIVLMILATAPLFPAWKTLQ